MYPGITTAQLDNLAAEIAVDMTGLHPDYAILAARISVSNLHKETHDKFSDVTRQLHSNVHPKTGRPNPLVSKKFLDVVEKHAAAIDAAIDYQHDYDFNYFGFKTLEQNYLMKINGKTVERPQQMMMRVALAIHGDNLELAFKTYEYTSQKFFTFAATTLLNAGTECNQLASFFEVQMKEDR
jgi:ribonucleoside-diphosphate reductase subunit M1